MSSLHPGIALKIKSSKPPIKAEGIKLLRKKGTLVLSTLPNNKAVAKMQNCTSQFHATGWSKVITEASSSVISNDFIKSIQN
jgi:hypothetical protein